MVKCKICQRNAIAYIRGIRVCITCFSLFKKDNHRRADETIKDFKILRECIRCRTRELCKISYTKIDGYYEVDHFYCGSCE